MKTIELKSIYKDYIMDGGYTQKVLKGIDLEIEKGEFVSIVGPSGSGKSTLMNVLGCLDQPSSGDYYLDGQNVARLKSNQLAAVRRKKLGFVFQGFNLLARRTLADNVSLPLIYCGISKEERDRRASKLLKLVGLEGYEKHHPTQISGGMQQRVAIARALVNNPEVILADEPTGNLDTKTSREIMDLITELNQQKGITVILVTHEPDIVEYSKRVCFIRDGVKEFDGTISAAKKNGFA